jgi:hypothetical protein
MSEKRQLVFLDTREFMNPFRPFVEHSLFKRLLELAHDNAIRVFSPSIFLFGMEYSFERNLTRPFSKRADFSFEPQFYSKVMEKVKSLVKEEEDTFRKVLYVISVSGFAEERNPFSELFVETGFLVVSITPLICKYSFFRKVDEIYEYELRAESFVPLDRVVESKFFAPIVQFWREYLPQAAEECGQFYDKLYEIFNSEGGKK